jgi:predicted dehydrogenase
MLNQPSSRKLRAAVIGTGHLGQYHAQKYQQLENIDLVAIVDLDHTRATQIAEQYHTQALTDYTQLAGMVDIVSIVTPSSTHYKIGSFCLAHKIHSLIEKPITTSVSDAQKLIKLAQYNHLVLQVGHIERFNSIVLQTGQYMRNVKFIESTRVMPFNQRNKDVCVVLDLMIHDLDLIQMIELSKIIKIDASGVKVISDSIDVVSARIQFASGTVANLTASRVSSAPERKMRIFADNCYLSLDFQEKSAVLASPSIQDKQTVIKKQTIQADTQQDALLVEITAFVDAVINHTQPIVCGKVAMAALEAALEVKHQISTTA